jgi:GNAT superfamily N-acetyltransferase
MATPDPESVHIELEGEWNVAYERDVATTLAQLVNEAYATSEGTLWAARTERISPEAMAASIAAGEIAVAWAGDRPAGCIRVRDLGDAVFEFGVLAVAPDVRGEGIGDALVAFAEDLARSNGATTMELKLLEPIEGTHLFKAVLASWYTRLGYRVVGEHAAAEGWPEAADELAVPCKFVVYQKPLTRGDQET